MATKKDLNNYLDQKMGELMQISTQANQILEIYNRQFLTPMISYERPMKILLSYG